MKIQKIIYLTFLLAQNNTHFVDSVKTCQLLKNLCVTKKFIKKNNKINNIAQNIYKYYGYNPKKIYTK